MQRVGVIGVGREGHSGMGNSIGPPSHSASRRRFLVVAIAGGVTALAGCDAPGNNAGRFNATDITDVQWGRGFELTDHSGRRRTLTDFKGKVVLLFFGYTNCPGPCPTALAEMAQVVKRVGADRVQGLFVTVDPERDTPEKLAGYVPAFHPSLLGLRGSPEQTAQVAKEFKIHFQAQKTDKGNHSGHGGGEVSYMVDHSTGIFILDRQGEHGSTSEPATGQSTP